MKIQPKYVMIAIIALIAIIGDICLFTYDFDPQETSFLFFMYAAVSAIATFITCALVAVSVISSNSWNPKDWE